MKVLTCYKVLQPGNETAGGVGQGGGGYWQTDVGQRLQCIIAAILNGSLTESPRPHGRDSFDRIDYDVPDEHHHIAYLQLFEVPHKRPADFVWSIISDYIGMEEVLEDFLERAKPNLLISFQYPLDPPAGIPTVPQLGQLPNLVRQCERHGCQVVYLPWFNSRPTCPYYPDKHIAGMCTGKMSGTYPWRDAVWKYLQALKRPDIVLSGNPTGSTFTLSDEDYRYSLAHARYYFSGGIYDLQIPPKYYEVCNYGACLVSPKMPMMEASGFVAGETYLEIKSLDEVPKILASDAWRDISSRGQSMVQRRHSIINRAADIVKVYRKMTGADNE